MITSEEINWLAKTNKVKPYQQEKHYLQTATLAGIYTALTDEIVFKGGTALFLCYGLDRFSEDLDFTQQKKYDYHKLQKTITDFLTLINIIHELKTEKSPTGKTMKLKAQGPLYKKPKSETFITLEISERNDLVFSPDLKEVVPMYDDLRPFTLPVMKKEEILAEKVRALLIRGRARDLYDISFLMKKNVSFDEKLINKKLSYYNKTFSPKDFSRCAKAIKDIWQSELHGLLPKIPPFDDVLNFVLNH